MLKKKKTKRPQIGLLMRPTTSFVKYQYKTYLNNKTTGSTPSKIYLQTLKLEPLVKQIKQIFSSFRPTEGQARLVRSFQLLAVASGGYKTR